MFEWICHENEILLKFILLWQIGTENEFQFYMQVKCLYTQFLF